MDKEDKTSLIGPLPLVIGVTGHRDLAPQDIPRIRESLAALFVGLRRQYPHTPLRLLSPLAEGADRLVAKVALEHGAELVVPLPMDEAEYRKDFRTRVLNSMVLKRRPQSFIRCRGPQMRSAGMQISLVRRAMPATRT